MSYKCEKWCDEQSEMERRLDKAVLYMSISVLTALFTFGLFLYSYCRGPRLKLNEDTILPSVQKTSLPFKDEQVVVIRTNKIQKDNQVAYEIDLDLDKNGAADIRTVFHHKMPFSAGEKTSLLSLLKDDSLSHIVRLENQR